MSPAIVKQGAVAVVAVSLAGCLTWLVKFLVTEIGSDIDFLIRLVDSTCGK